MRLLEEPFSPPASLDPVAMLEEHLAVGWEYGVEIIIDAPLDAVTRHLPRALGRLEPFGAEATRLIGSTSNPVWYAGQLVAMPAPYRIVRCPELREAAHALGQRLLAAGKLRIRDDRGDGHGRQCGLGADLLVDAAREGGGRITGRKDLQEQDVHVVALRRDCYDAESPPPVGGGDGQHAGRVRLGGRRWPGPGRRRPGRGRPERAAGSWWPAWAGWPAWPAR